MGEEPAVVEKKFYESKTFWFALLTIGVGLAGIFGFADYTPSEDVTEITTLVIGVSTLVLRLVTSKKITF